MMLSSLKQLDSLLRGHSTQPTLLQQGAAELSLKRLLTMSLILGGVYGFFMGWYAVTTRDAPDPRQLLASTLKLPLLFLLTLVVTFPSLYVFSALTGCRLRFVAVLRLLVATITINLAVGASLAPILGFFTLSTQSYSFMILLNVCLLGVAGFVALGFLLTTLRRLAAAEAPEHTPLPLPRVVERTPGETGYGVFYIWVMIYGLVGAQMGWLLRPFIGHPDIPFQWFRHREGNFFNGLFTHLQHLFNAAF